MSGVTRDLAGSFVLGALVAGACSAATTSPTDPPGAACLAIVDRNQRLDCFDREIGAAVRGDEAVTTAQIPAATPEPLTVNPAFERASLQIDAAWGQQLDSPPNYVRLFRPNYLLLARYTDSVNVGPYQSLLDEADDLDSVEAKFQLSFKTRLAASDDRRLALWLAYTQDSQWQVFNAEISRPFRETNYMPEIFGSFRPGVMLGDWQWDLLNVGLTHQSNGRSDPISRSWDRLFVEAGIEKGPFVVLARAWTRVRPSGYEDDNPDITDYMGYGEVTAFLRRGENSFTLWARGNLHTGKGAGQFTWTTRRFLGPLRGYLQVFTGYGESLIDYDWSQTTIGVGVTLNDVF